MVLLEDYFITIMIMRMKWWWWSRYHQGWQPNGVLGIWNRNLSWLNVKIMVMITVSSGLEVEWCSLNKELQLSPIWNFPPHSTPSWRHTINRCRFYILMFCHIERYKKWWMQWTVTVLCHFSPALLISSILMPILDIFWCSFCEFFPKCYSIEWQKWQLTLC